MANSVCANRENLNVLSNTQGNPVPSHDSDVVKGLTSKTYNLF
jgi:hypothetical protein